MVKQKPLTFVVLLGVLLALCPSGLAAQVHFGLPAAVKSKAKQLKKEKDEKTQKITYKLAPQSKVLSPAANAGFLGVSADSATYRYSLGAAEIGALRAGDILLSAQGGGHMRKVLSVADTGAEYQVQTTTAALEDAFTYLDYSFHKVFTAGDVVAAGLPQGVRGKEAGGGKIQVVYEDVVITNGIKADIVVAFQPDITFNAKIEGWLPPQITEVTFIADNAASVEVELKSELKTGIDKKVKVGPPLRLPLPPIAGILPANLEIQFVIILKAEVGLKASCAVYDELRLKTGVLYKKGQPVEIFAEPTNVFTFSPPSLSINGDAKLSGGPEFAIKAAGLVGPYLRIAPYAKLEGDYPLFPSTGTLAWALNGGLEAAIGIKGELFGISLVDYEKSPLVQYEVFISSGRIGNSAPVISSVTASPAAVSTGAATTITCSASDADGDTLAYAWSAASGTLSAVTGSSVSWTAPAAGGGYTISVTVSDGYGGSAQQSVNVTASAGGQGMNKICLLVKNVSSLDPEELAAVNFAQGKGHAVTLAGPPEIISGALDLSSFDGFWSHTGAVPTGFNTAAVLDPIKLQIQNGKYLLVSWQGKYLAQYLGAASVVTGTWSPVVYDTSYLVDIKVPHPLFTGIPAWTPPTGPPDNSAQMIWKVNPGIRSAISLTPPTASSNQAMVVILTTYDWPGQSPNYALGSQYGVTPTTQRNILYAQGANEYALGSGKVIEFTAWNGELTSVDGTRGTAGEKIYENALKYLTKTLP